MHEEGRGLGERGIAQVHLNLSDKDVWNVSVRLRVS